MNLTVGLVLLILVSLAFLLFGTITYSESPIRNATALSHVDFRSTASIDPGLRLLSRNMNSARSLCKIFTARCNEPFNA